MLPYTTPTLYDAGGDISKKWYIQYWFKNPGTGKMERFKPTFDINRQKTKADRYAWGSQAVKFMADRLAAGYDPFEEEKLQMAAPATQAPIYTQPKPVNDPPKQNNEVPGCIATLRDRVNVMLITATPQAKHTYTVVFNRFEKFVIAKDYKEKPITDVDVTVAYEFQNWGKDEKKWSRKTVNATISHLGLFWDELIKAKKISNNPWRQVSTLKKKDYRGKVKSSVDREFMPLTGMEMDAIIGKFNEFNKRNFLRFLGCIYYAWARPVEITRLRIGDIDMLNKSIRFRKDITKDDEHAYVQIVDPLYNMLLEMDLEKYPSKYYLFSKDDFLPGEKKLNAWHDCTNRLWTPVVQMLGIDKYMYSLKATGNIEYLLKNKGNVDIKWQQMQNRHSSPAVTEIYNKRLGVYFVDTQAFNFRQFI